MTYTVKTAPPFEKNFKRLDKPTQRKLKTWISKNLVGCDDPRLHGKALAGQFKSLWRYRVGVYRIIADISDTEITFLLLDVGHRKNIYKR